MKTLIITTNVARAAATLASVAHLSPEIFPGADASAWTKESPELKIIRASTSRAGLLYGQAGCTLAHVRLWAHIANQESEPCLVLEDDAIMEAVTPDPETWPECEFLWLYGNPNPEKNPLPVGVSEYARLHNPGTVAYRLTPAGARQLLTCFANPLGFEGVQLPEAVDVALAGLLSSRRFAAKVLFPHPFRHEDGGDSTIRNGRYVVEPISQKNTDLDAKSILRAAEINGLEVPFGDVKLRLRCGESDRNAFSQRLTLFLQAEASMTSTQKTAFRAGQKTTVVESSGTSHEMTVGQYQQLMLAYGSAYDALWTAAAQAQ